MRPITHWIDGEPVTANGAPVSEVFNPATGKISGLVPLASDDQINQAVSAGIRAFPQWSGMSLGRRSAVMFNFRNCLRDRTDELARIITAEHGKTLQDAAGEIARGIEVAEYACAIPHLLEGRCSYNASTNVDVLSVNQPLGCVAIVSPFNFPAMVPLWFAPVALACGNTVVLKPSERDPSAATILAEAFIDAGGPPGVFNVVHGNGASVEALLHHPHIAAMSFVGSTPVARHVYATAAAQGKRVQALGGAKNHMVVLPDADLDAASNAAVSAAFGSAGERCMAISAVVAIDSIADDLVSRIGQLSAKLRVGDGHGNVDMGPMITAQQRDRVAGYIESGVTAGATLVVDGRDVDPDGAAGGFWLGPTVLDHVDTSMDVYRDEVFGPLLVVLRVPDLDSALAMIAANPYGNGAAIFTRDGAAARNFQLGAAAGMVGINLPIPVPVAWHSFGGWGSSLFGDSNAYGEEGVRFFTQRKTVTQRWADDGRSITMSFPHTG